MILSHCEGTWPPMPAIMSGNPLVFAGKLSGTKKEHQPKLLSPDIFRWGRGLPHEGVGAKKLGMSLETREIKLLWRDIPGFCWDIPAVLEKFEKKFVFNLLPLKHYKIVLIFTDAVLRQVGTSSGKNESPSLRARKRRTLTELGSGGRTAPTKRLFKGKVPVRKGPWILTPNAWFALNSH